MDEKTLHTLEYDKILDRLAGYCAFAVSAEKARQLHPTQHIELAQQLQSETREAIQLLVTHADLTIGGSRDVRAAVELAARNGVLLPTDMLDVKSTLTAARSLGRTFERLQEQFPNLYQLVAQMPRPYGLIDAITRVLSERGEILDSASNKLAVTRRDLRIAHDRLLTRLQRMVNDPKNTPYLQEALITQREGRYVLPLRSEFKGRIKSIVHDQSSSGATLFVEPLAVVDHNNKYRELQLAERDEERRILADLSRLVGNHAEDILRTLETVADLDMILARAKYAEDLAAVEPALHPFDRSNDSRHPGSIIRLYQARHPLLSPQTVVPIDLELDPQTYALIVTGPNTGGKTVSLKTAGLLALMAQSGLHIPAHSGSEISVFENVYADIGDEQSIEQSLSTFSSHVSNIIRILEKANRRSLVILDELGAGTDPQEGAALARSILTHLLDRSITTLVTTHHPELKAYAHATPGVVNASVEFDLETLRPTYHLTIGLPGRSNALSIARRLGLPEEIVSAARAELDPSDLRSEDLLDEIHRQRDLARQAREASEKARHQSEALRAELSRRLEQVEDERLAILEKARTEAASQMESLGAEIRQARRELARARQPVEALQEVEEKIAELEDQVDQPSPRRIVQTSALAQARALRLGDRVKLRTLNTQGILTALGEEEAEIQVGVLRIRARLAELSPADPDIDDTVQKQPSSRKRHAGPDASITTSGPLLAASPGMELDLRGQRADEAMDALDRYLDAAYLAGMPFVRIIHGKGTGKLRQAVRQALSQNPQVKTFESGGEKEGGEGVTVVKFRDK